jgi:hypothetical protein
MNPAQGVLARLESSGIRLQADGNTLRAAPREKISDDLRRLIREHRPALLELVQSLAGKATPPPLREHDETAIREVLEERAAIREFEGGEDRATAEREARRAMRVFQYRLTDKPASWLILICPGCDLGEARRSVESTFGPERVLAVEPYRLTTP